MICRLAPLTMDQLLVRRASSQRKVGTEQIVDNIAIHKMIATSPRQCQSAMTAAPSRLWSCFNTWILRPQKTIGKWWMTATTANCSTPVMSQAVMASRKFIVNFIPKEDKKGESNTKPT